MATAEEAETGAKVSRPTGGIRTTKGRKKEKGRKARRRESSNHGAKEIGKGRKPKERTPPEQRRSRGEQRRSDFPAAKGLAASGPRRGQMLLLKELGIALWLVVRFESDLHFQATFLQNARDRFPWIKRLCQDSRVSRRKRALFPLPSIWTEDLEKMPRIESWNQLARKKLHDSFAVAVWCELSVLFCNHMENGEWAIANDKPSKPQNQILKHLQSGVDERFLREDREVDWSEEKFHTMEKKWRDL